MSDDPVLKIYETQAELEKIKEEVKEIQKQNNKLKNEIAFKNLIETVNEVQSKVDVLSTNVKEIQQTVIALFNRVSNHDDKLSEQSENLRKLNEKLNKNDTVLSQHNEVSPKQNETIQVLETSKNSIEKRTILLVGGEDEMNNDSLLILENNRKNWKELNIKLPYAVRDHGAQFFNNNLYIFGGEGEEGILNLAYKLSKSLQWEKMTAMNQKRRWISNSSVILNNQIWVCGGNNDSSDKGIKSVEMYDPETNKWKYIRQMNECRRHAAAAVVNGKIFCSGGWNENPLDSIECYDPSSDVWTRICDMPPEVCGHGAVAIGGNFIVIGGQKRFLIIFDTFCNDVWRLDTTNEKAKWIEKTSMSIPRRGFSIAKINGKIFVCGGETKEDKKHKIVDDVEIFDGEVWRSGPKMPTSRVWAPAVVIPMEFASSLN